MTTNTVINNTFRNYFVRFAQNSGLIKFIGVLLNQTLKKQIVTIAIGKDMDRLRLKAQCSAVTTTTWPIRLISIIFSMIRCLSLLTKTPVFLQTL